MDVFSEIWDYDPEYNYILVSIVLSLFLDIVLVYFNLYVLIPKFALREKLVQYIFFTILSLIFVCGINTYEDFYFYGNEEDYHPVWTFYYSFLATVGILAPAIAIKISKYFYEESIRISDIETYGLKSELNYLKQQINPHFLFNSLNNIYIMSREKSVHTPDTILQLSDLMRYQTYEAAKDKVLLSKEIEFLDNYLKLEQLRRDNLTVNYDVNGNPARLLIEPLLFLPFIENACKYSSKTDGSKEEIHMIWSISDNQLQFNIENEKGVSRPNDKEHSGFGLDNVRKRLELLYPEKHKLSITDKQTVFSVDLIIEL